MYATQESGTVSLPRAESFHVRGGRLPKTRGERAATVTANFDLVASLLPVKKRVVRAGEVIYRMGEALETLALVHCGSFKSVAYTDDGREQLIGVHFREEWLGIDAISSGTYGADVVAVDVGSIWTINYRQLAAAACKSLPLTLILHRAMSWALNREREAMLMLGSLSAEARVAAFLLTLSDAHESSGRSGAMLVLRLSRAEIGSYLGLALETVSRALAKLARESIIRLNSTNGREIDIIDLGRLRALASSSETVRAPLQ
jgi:CRP/FNR family transcriptional regulator